MISRPGLTLRVKNATLWLLVIVVLGTLLRIYKIDFKSMWIDELYSIVPVNPNNTVAFIIEHCKSDQPPLFFLLLHYWFKLTTYTAFSGRLLSAIFGILSIIAVYFLGKEIKNERTGLFAGLLTAVNYFHLYYSQELRFYSLLFLLTVVSFIFFLRSLKRKNFLSYSGYVLSTIGLLYTQYFGLLIFVIQGFIFLGFAVFNKERLSFILTGVFVAIVIGASFIPWLPTLLYDSQISSYWIPVPKPYFLAVYYYVYWGKDVLSAMLLLAVSFMYMWDVYKSVKEKTISEYQIFVACMLGSWLLLSYGIPYVRSLISTPMLIPRYTLVSLPAIFIVMALGFDLIKNTTVRKIVVSIITVASVVNMVFIQKHYTTINKAQWREAAQTVINNHEPGVIVYSNLEWWYNYFFYFTDPYIKVLGKYPSNEVQELQPFIDLIGSEKKFWVLNGEGVPGLSGLQQEYVDKHFKVGERHDFYASSAILYLAK